MDEAHEILLSSLKSSGVSLPVGVSSVKDLFPDALVSICVQSLSLILDSHDSSLPTSLPTATAERFKICAKVASAMKSIGYREDLSFNQFLYPSNEESYKLVRFLVERLSEVLSEGIKVDKNRPISENNELLNNSFKGQSSKTSSSEPESSGSKKNSCREKTSEGQSDREKTSEGQSDRGKIFIDEPEIKWPSQQEHVTKFRNETKDLKKQEKILKDKMLAKAFDVQKLQDEHDILKASLDLAINSQQSVEIIIQELDAKVKIRQQSVMELEMKRNVAECSAIGKRMNLEQSVYSEQPEVQERCLRLKEIERETHATMDEISKREAEYLDLLMEFEKQPKLPSRKLYIKRITEITKNSWKLDADIQQILKETRELQLESNSIQERLHRTYAVVDEIVFREAKKDAVGRQAYRHLTSIHDSFQQIADTILATDRARRETAEQQAKLAALSSRSFDITKLQADLDSIRKENELLEQQCPHS